MQSIRQPHRKSITASLKSGRTATKPDSTCSTFSPKVNFSPDPRKPHTHPASDTAIMLSSPTVIENLPSSPALYASQNTPKVTVGVSSTTRNRRRSSAHPRSNNAKSVTETMVPILYLPPRFRREIKRLLLSPKRALQCPLPSQASLAASNGRGKSYTKRSAKPRRLSGSPASSRTHSSGA